MKLNNKFIDYFIYALLITLIILISYNIFLIINIRIKASKIPPKNSVQVDTTY